MSEKDLIKLWQNLRMQIIIAQLAPSLVLIGIFVLAGMDKFASADDGTKYLTIGVAAVTGILAIISQYAAVREGQAVIADLADAGGKSVLGRRIANSASFLSLSAAAFVGFGILIFGLVVWAVLG